MTSLWDQAFKRLSVKDQTLIQFNQSNPREILLNILSTVEVQRDRCLRSRSKVTSINGREIVIRDVCTKISHYVKTFVEVGDVAVQYDPVHASLPWAALRFVLQLSLNSVETFEAIVEGIEKVSSVIARCAIIESLFLPSGSNAQKALEEDLLKLYVRVLEFLCEARKYYKRSWIKRFLADTTRRKGLQGSLQAVCQVDDVVRMRQELVDSERIQQTGKTTEATKSIATTLQSAVSNVESVQSTLRNKLLQLEMPIVRGMDQLSDLHTAMEDSEKARLLRWLSTIQVKQHHNASLASVLNGSGQWLIADARFTTWRDSSSSEVFWLRGIPGCGKSKLATTVIQSLQQRVSTVPDSAPVAYFYCSGDESELHRANANEILRALLKQLALPKEDGPVRPVIVEKAKKAGTEPVALSTNDCVELMVDLASTGPAMMVIDAVDECDPYQRHILLSALDKIMSDSRDVVKVFISSRNEEDIRSQLRGAGGIYMSPKDGEEDLKKFVAVQVEQFVRTWSSIHGGSAKNLKLLEQQIIETLTKEAQGMFLWVSLQLESLRDFRKIKTTNDIREALQTLPPTLTKSYHIIYSRIESMMSTSISIAKATFRWLLCARRVLQVDELVAAVTNDLEGSTTVSPTDMLNCCCNLVILDTESNVFRLTHSSVREYLLSLPEYAIGSTNALVAQNCLGMFLSNQVPQSDLSDYACQYWADHYGSADATRRNGSLGDSLLAFFTKEEHFEDWLMQLSQKGLPVNPGQRVDLSRKLNAASSSLPSPLFVICCFGLIEALENTAFAATLELEQLNQHNTSGLYLAARWGHTSVVWWLLDHGANINSPGQQFGSATQAAAFGGYKEILSMLLEKNPDLSVQAETSSPVQAALIGDHEEVAEQLIDGQFVFDTQQQFDDAFQTASFGGHVNVVQALLEGKAGNFRPKEIHEPLQVALHKAKERKSRELLDACADINSKGGYFGNALQAAVSGGKLSLVKAVVEKGGKLDERGRFGYPLRAAAATGKSDITQYLLDQGADPNAQDDELGDPLQAAASKGYLNTMQVLLERQDDVNGRGGFFGNALQAASFTGHIQSVKLLLENNARLDAPGKFRDALQAAIQAGKDDIVNLLLERGAHLNPGRFPRSYYCNGSTRALRRALPRIHEHSGQMDIPREQGPLEIASRCGNVQVMEKLIQMGARIDAYDANPRDDEYDEGCSYTALQIASFWGHKEAVYTLLRYGADINAVRQTLGTPLQAALEASNFEIAQLLLDHGAEIDKHWMEFGSCLQVFCERGNMQVVRFLVENGANIEDSGGLYGNALQVACYSGHLDIVRFLLDKGADKNAPSRNKGSALESASANGHVEIVKHLLDHSPEVVIPYTALGCALHSAAAGGHESTVKVLLDNGSDIHFDYGYETWWDETEFRDALFSACQTGHTRTAKLLFTRDPWSYIHHNTFERALRVGIMHENTDVVAMLVFEGARSGFSSDRFSASIHPASQMDDPTSIRLLLDSYPELLQGDQCLDALHKAARMKRKDTVLALVRKGANVNHVDREGNSVLANAFCPLEYWERPSKGIRISTLGITPPWADDLSRDAVETVRLLLNAGAQVDNSCRSKTRLDYIATQVFSQGDTDLLIRLQAQELHVTPRADTREFSKALKDACGSARLDMVRHLSSSVQSTKPESFKPAVLVAVRSGHKDVLKALLGRKECVELLKCSNENPLVEAAKHGHVELINLLLKTPEIGLAILELALEQALRGALSPDWPPYKSYKGFQLKSIKLLLEHGKDHPRTTEIYSQFFSRFWPEVAGGFGTAEVFNYFLSNGVDPDFRNAKGETALYIASAYGQVERVKSLLQYGAKVNLEGGEAGTALHAAVKNSMEIVTDLLLEAGADADARVGNFSTPLALSMCSSNKKSGFSRRMPVSGMPDTFKNDNWIAERLLAYGADVDANWGHYGTALQAATVNGHKSGVKLLLERDADVNVKGGQFGSALKAARANGKDDIAQMLLDAGATDG